MFLTVTLNPILDKTVVVRKALLGKIQRVVETEEVVGGKGNNVARTIRKFGWPVVASGFVGGYVGERIKILLRKEGIETDFVEVKENSRFGITLREIESGRYTHYLDPNRKVSRSEVERLTEKIKSSLSKYKLVIFSGSSPSSSADRIYYRLINLCRRKNIFTFLDTYGQPLKFALLAKPFFLKLNLAELEGYLGEVANTKAKIVAAIRQILSLGVKIVIITQGRKPAYIGGEGKIYRFLPPKVVEVNAIGSGDALVGGVAVGMAQKWPLEKAIKWGFACSLANVKVWRPIGFSRKQVEIIFRQLKEIEPLLTLT